MALHYEKSDAEKRVNMSRYIVTIGREFGCGAREIARGLASQLAIPLYDKDLVDMTASKAGLHVDLVREADENSVKKQKRLFSEFGYGSSTSFYSEEAIQAQAQVICDIANKQESSIIFGRCADYILREYPNIISVFLYAPLDFRTHHISEGYGLSEPDAIKLIKQVDRQRHNYYKYVTGKNRGDRDGKNIMIDVSTYGVNGTIELICNAIDILNK